MNKNAFGRWRAAASSRVCRAAVLFTAAALALAVAGCSSSGGQIDVIGLPRKTENGQTTNRHTIYQKSPPSPRTSGGSAPQVTAGEIPDADRGAGAVPE